MLVKSSVNRLNSLLLVDEHRTSSKLMWALKARDKELIKEQQYNASHVCPVCHYVKARSGECSCNYN